MARDAAASETRLRRAVYGGLVASVFATGGWLLWLFVRAVMEDWTALFGPLVGAALGVVVHAAEHYHEVAEYEREGGKWPPEEEEEEKEPPPRRFGDGLARSVALLALGFVALTCEHVVGDLMKDYFLPFVVSLAALFPAGALLTAAFEAGDDESGFFYLLFRGGIVGLATGAVVAGVQWSTGLSTDLGGVFGWWALIGIALSYACGKGALRVGRACLALGIAFALLVAFSLPYPYRLAKAVGAPAIVAPVLAVGMSVSGVIEAPDMPSRFWREAERREERRAKPPVAEGEAAPGREAEREPSAFGRWLAGLVGDDPEEPASPSTEPADATPPPSRAWDGEPLLPSPTTLPNVSKLPPFRPTDPVSGLSDRIVEHRRKMREDLLKGWGSGFVRSWLVMALFVLGLGLAPWVEEELRPRDYPSSRTAYNDRVLAGVLVAFVLLTCAVLRLFPSLAG